MKQMRYTRDDFDTDFPDEKACLLWLKEYLYPDGIVCKVCKKATPHHLMNTRKSFSCEVCGHHVHPTAGTIFHKSSTPLRKWFQAVYLMSSTRAGISAKQLERELGVTYKTAWRIFHQIRTMMADDTDNLSGEVEVDEMYIQPDPRKRSSVKGGRSNSKVVFGMVERGGRVKVKHVKSSGARVLLPEIEQHVDNRAIVYSDEYRSYYALKKKGYDHNSVNHGEHQYVVGRIHTQNIENVWSHMKRGIKGVYRHVDAQYLQAYLDEYAFRYSHRHDYQPMFWALLDNIAKR